MTRRWLQIRGDPSVRDFVFEQTRALGAFDARLDEVLERTGRLIRDHGVFHAKIHFSSNRVTLWLLSDPLRYRVYVKDEFLDPAFCSVLPRVAYTSWAVVPRRAVGKVLQEFRHLRIMDPHLYLRAGSLNVVNGQVGLNFSCDGSHYVDYADFLANAGQFTAGDDALAPQPASER